MGVSPDVIYIDAKISSLYGSIGWMDDRRDIAWMDDRMGLSSTIQYCVIYVHMYVTAYEVLVILETVY